MLKNRAHACEYDKAKRIVHYKPKHYFYLRVFNTNYRVLSEGLNGE